MSLLNTQKANDITAEQVLAIAEAEPEKLFSKASEEQIKKEYRQLAKIWHTDLNKDPKAKDVMPRLQALYDKANEKLKNNKWEIPNLFRFTANDGKNYQIHYWTKQAFELGDAYIAQTSVTYVLNKSDRELFDNAKNTISNFKFANDDMKKRMAPLLPEVKRTFETSDKLILVLDKHPNSIPLNDTIKYYGGKIEPKHAAWMTSRLNYLTCYLEWAGLTHNGINVDNCLIEPENHCVTLVGGWWYATPEGKKLKALPPKTTAIAPASVFKDRIASKKLDLALIRSTSREILGDATGMNLIRNTDIPKPVTDWVNGVSPGNALADYKFWSDDVLTKSFGARRFIEMKLTPNDIYKP